MNCEGVAGTGTPLAAILLVAAACLLLGLLLVGASRSGRQRGTTTAVTALLLLSGALASGIAAAPPASSLPANCLAGPSAQAHPHLTITQTSTMSGLAPGVAPAAITGLIANNGSSATHVIAVTVSIVSVVKARGAAPGSCGASDYILIDPRMPVDRTVHPQRPRPSLAPRSASVTSPRIRIPAKTR